MSIKDFIKEKLKKPTISVDINEYEDVIRTDLLGLKDRKKLYDIFLNLEQLSRCLNYIDYPKKNEILFYVSMQDITKHNDEYIKFLEWSKNNKNETTEKIQKRIANIRSFALLDSEVTLDDIDIVTNYKCESVLETSKFISDILSDADDYIKSSWIKIKPKSDTVFELNTENESFKVTFKDYSFNLESLNESDIHSDVKVIQKTLNEYNDKYKELYFVTKKSERNRIQESIRRMYLGKYYTAFKYSFETNKPIVSENYDIWKIKVKNKHTRFEFGSYRLIDDSAPIRYIKLEQQ